MGLRRSSIFPVIFSTLATILVLVSAQQAQSQAARTIKVVVPFPPGGGADTLARLLGEQIGRAQGLTVVVENRPGAGSIIGTEAVLRAAPDGNTLLIIGSSMVINPHLRKVNYDGPASFEPICDLVVLPEIIVVNSSSPYRTLADLIRAARAKPGELTAASTPATVMQIAFEMLKREADVKITFVPYPGDAPAINALLGEHVSAALVTYPPTAEQVKAGKLRALASLLPTRIETLPDVPAIAEAGYKAAEVEAWYGLFAPLGTPKETIVQLAGWFTAALQAREVKPKLAKLGLFPAGTCGADFAASLRKQYDLYGRVIREANIKAE